jgi:RimJ/RimL family protein N-acetyltransferase/aryl carrier-like protein
MTAVDERTSRDALRDELAALLELEPDLLTDTTRLTNELALDSLSMMRLLTWLESRGVAMHNIDRDRPVCVGQVLTLLEGASAPGVSIRVMSGPDTLSVGPAAIPTGPRLSVDPLAPVLETRALWLTPVQPDDLRFLYGLAVHPETSFRWRYRGAPPPIDRFADNLWKQVLVQYVARRVEDKEPVGHIVAYGADPSMRFAYIGAVFLPEYAGTGLAAQVVAAFMRYLFHTFPLRKLYMEIPGFNWAQLQSGGGRFFQVEGVLRDHNYYAGRYWDEYICAVYRDRLVEEVGPDDIAAATRTL